MFLHDQPWISPWIKSISNELDITIHVIAFQLSGHCDVINNRLWRHQQNENRASETRWWCVKIVVCIVIYLDSLRRVRNKLMYVLPWRTVSALTRVLFRCLFYNKHQNNPLASAGSVRHSSIYIILDILTFKSSFGVIYIIFALFLGSFTTISHVKKILTVG